jgi:hypothetical protein
VVYRRNEKSPNPIVKLDKSEFSQSMDYETVTDFFYPTISSRRKLILMKVENFDNKMEVEQDPPSSGSINVVPALTNAKYLELYCFGCCLMGNIESEFSRETRFKFMEKNNLLMDCRMGWTGCRQSCLTCILGSIGWPLSPCLSCYLLRERWKLKLFYPFDDRLSKPKSFSEYCHLFCCWPKNLYEQHTFIHQLANEGNLTFSWDYKLFRDHAQKQVDHTSYAIAVFGPNTDLKKEFIRKFLMETKNKETADLHQKFPLLKELNHIQTGVRSVLMEDGKQFKFFEIWDIPINEFYHNYVGYLKEQTVVASIYLFDINDSQNFDEMKKVFQHYDFLVTKPRIILLLKDSAVNNLTNDNNMNNNKNMNSNNNSKSNNQSRTNLLLSPHNASTHSLFGAQHTHNSSQENLLQKASFSSMERLDRVSLEAETLTWAKRQGVMWYHFPLYDDYYYLTLNRQLMKLLPDRNQAEPGMSNHNINMSPRTTSLEEKRDN